MHHGLYRGGNLLPVEKEWRFMRAVTVVAIVIVLAITLGDVADYLNSPRVYVSNSTGKCVRVVSPKGEHPCAPGDEKKYERVWVK